MGLFQKIISRKKVLKSIKEGLIDQKTLTQIAMFDKDEQVRKVAREHITDRECLMQLKLVDVFLPH